MTYLRLGVFLAGAGLAALLSGCVVVPIGPYPVATYPGGVYVEPTPVVVVPALGYSRGYRGYRGFRHWR